jgi:phenylalanyl-tRNA synthetase alpha chain
MSDTTEKIDKRFDQLGISRPEQVLQLFSEARVLFDSQAFSAASHDDSLIILDLYKRWVESQSGYLKKIEANWAKSAEGRFKTLVERAYQHLRTHVAVGIRAVQTLQQQGIKNEAELSGLFQLVSEAFKEDIASDIDELDLEITRLNWLGRKTGILTWISDHWVRKAPPEFKRQVGRLFNGLKNEIEMAFQSRTQEIQRREQEPQASELSNEIPESTLSEESFDLSLPGVVRPIGTHHLVRTVMQEIEDIFFSIGFSVVEGPEIETPYYNFEALNIPEHHPVRDDMDTFYLDLPKGAPGPLLLRTHTSPVQIRTMEKRQPPVRVIVPGKVYRRDNPDATHSFVFHQIEGLAVDTDITFCDFTGTIEYFVKQFFGESVKTRFRPSYFPFTEPSVEFDVSCIFCGGSGTGASGATCGKCKGSGWIELFGAGMVDPAVYGFVNYDARKVSGFAFGMGMDRLAMLKYGIDDIQVFFQNDVRFLRQFP